MASQVYTEFKRANAAGEIDLNADPLYTILVMTNTTVDTEEDTATVSAFTTLDEMDGANYNSAARQELDSIAVNKDDANNRAEFDAADETWTSLGNGTRAMQGVVIYKDPDDDGAAADDALNIPICFVEFSASQNSGGSNFSIAWNAEGILQLA